MTRPVKVRRRRLPGIGDRFELDTASGVMVSVVTHRSGRGDLGVGERGQDEPSQRVALTRALAALVRGTHIEFSTQPAD